MISTVSKYVNKELVNMYETSSNLTIVGSSHFIISLFSSENKHTENIRSTSLAVNNNKLTHNSM
jgi:hypothetical protein